MDILSGMGNDESEDLRNVCLLALRLPTRQLIISALQKEKVIPSCNGLWRDYRGLAHLAQIELTSSPRKVAELLTKWQEKPGATLAKLEDYLSQIDRWDIVDDIHHLIRDDAKAFLERKSLVNIATNEVLVCGDAERLEQGLELVVFDALVLYDDQELHFAREIVERLEKAGCKTCLKKDLLPGLHFEEVGVMQLIRKRCRRVIIIFSQHFLDNPSNVFFVLYAQSISIGEDRAILIPIIYGRGACLPSEINQMTNLDFNRSLFPKYNFWGKLVASVCPVMVPERRALPRCEPVTIKEIVESPNTPQPLLDTSQLSVDSLKISSITPSSPISTTQTKEKQHKQSIFKSIFKRTKKSKQRMPVAVAL